MNTALVITVIVVLLIHQSLQDNVSLACDSKFDCKIFNISSSTELTKFNEKISSGVYVNVDGTQINISQIAKISFKNSKFQELPEGLFNETLFASLKTINLSGVGLQKINLAKFTMIEVLDISNNELTSVEISGHFRSPKIKSINLKKNYWNCSYLTKLLESLSELNVKQTEISQNEVHGCNILGIECFCSIGNQIDMKINEILEAFIDQESYHDMFLSSFDFMQKFISDMDSRSNENNLKMNLTILSIHNMGNTCNETADMNLINEEENENIEEFVELSTNLGAEKDVITNVNISSQNLIENQKNLTTKVDELAAIVTQRWSMVPLPSSNEPETSTLWLWIILMLIVVALVTYIWIYHRTSINSVIKMFR